MRRKKRKETEEEEEEEMRKRWKKKRICTRNQIYQGEKSTSKLIKGWGKDKGRKRKVNELEKKEWIHLRRKIKLNINHRLTKLFSLHCTRWPTCPYLLLTRTMGSLACSVIS